MAIFADSSQTNRLAWQRPLSDREKKVESIIPTLSWKYGEDRSTVRYVLKYDKLHLPQMVVTIYKYTIENDLTEKIEKRKKKTHTNKWHVLI